MHDIHYDHQHELDEHDFLGCCMNCRRSLMIIKPHVLSFHQKIRHYSAQDLAALAPEELYRLYQVLDDVAHLEVGDRLAELILKDPEIHRILPTIRACYSTFFSLHEVHLAKELLGSRDCWETFRSFPLYPRYEGLIRNQAAGSPLSSRDRVAFIGCGPVPTSLILLNRLFHVQGLGLDSDPRAVSLARQCLECLGLEKDITVAQGDETRLEELEWDVAVVAALAEPKSRIFQNLKNILEKKGPAPVITRTYTGMRAILYRPVQPEDIQGFRIVKQIAPTGRINNTLVFLEKEPFEP